MLGGEPRWIAIALVLTTERLPSPFHRRTERCRTPKRGGTLQFAISAETPHYDCHGSDTYATLHFSAPFYSTLLRFNLDKFPEVQGDLADKWDVAPDLMTYTFKLHPGVKFHDGQD